MGYRAAPRPALPSTQRVDAQMVPGAVGMATIRVASSVSLSPRTLAGSRDVRVRNSPWVTRPPLGAGLGLGGIDTMRHGSTTVRAALSG